MAKSLYEWLNLNIPLEAAVTPKVYCGAVITLLMVLSNFQREL